MKVLLINSVLGIRSTGRICSDIANLLIRKNQECTVAFGREFEPANHNYGIYKIENSFFNRIDGLKSFFFNNSGFNSRKKTKQFLKWIDDFKPDIIHMHNLHGFYINVELLFHYIKKRKIPVVWTLHDCWSFTGHCTYFDLAKCNKWITGCNKCPQRHRYPYGFLLDSSRRNYYRKKTIFGGVDNLTIVTPSFWLKNLVEKSFLKEYKTIVIHNGVNTESFTKKKNQIRSMHNIDNETKIVLGVASTWDKGKGLFDFIRLSSLLPSSFVIILIGLTKEQMKIIPSNIIGIEKTNSVDELSNYYSASDVFLNLTYEDNYPTVNIESQLCGTPCITYDTGGSVESVPKENIFKQGDVETIAKELINNLDFYKNNILTRNDFDKNYAFAKYIDLYFEITSQKEK